jgi:hypothetical protein
MLIVGVVGVVIAAAVVFELRTRGWARFLG